MSQQPPRPARPASRPAPAAAQSKPAANGTATASRPLPVSQQAMETKSQQTAAGDDDDEEWDDEDSAMREWLRQAPSWLTSMVVHMILILTLALIPLGSLDDDSNKEITLFPSDNETEELDELQEDSLDELMETDVQIDTQFETNEVVDSNELMEISDKVDVPNDANDATLQASVDIPFDPTLISTTATTEVTDVLGGISKTGYGGREAANRASMARKTGGSPGSEAAVEAALAWLAKVQRPDGSWNYNDVGASPDPGSYDTAMGGTGLALLPFLGAGYTHDTGKYKKVVGKGLQYLVKNMGVANDRGRLYEANGASHAHMYSHGIAAMALCEAYGMAESGDLMTDAQLAINYIEYAQHPTNGGWLYTPRAGGDTSVVGWQIMALKSGHMSYLKVSPEVVSKADKWLDAVAFNSNSAYGYRKPSDRPADGATTAIGLLMRMYLGMSHEDPSLRMGVATLSKKGPSKTDMYYNYYATQVMRHYDGPTWARWNNQMRDYLIKTQNRQGHAAGSWHFDGPHGPKQGGRLYNTCMAAMILEVYYRHLPIYQKKSFTHKFGE